MYDVIKNVIESGRYELNDMLKKIDTIWIQGDITEEQKKELVMVANNVWEPGAFGVDESIWKEIVQIV